MNRDRAMKIIRRIVKTIETHQTAAPVRELYAFGSYARGAIEPNDLDLIVVHDPMPDEVKKSFQRRARDLGLDHVRRLFYPHKRFEGTMRNALRKPGEPVDLLLGETLEAVMETYTAVRDQPCVLLWSLDDRDIDAKLAAIVPDPGAGRAERPGFMTPKEAGCRAEEMRRVAAMLEQNMIIMQRWTLPDEVPVIHGLMRVRFDRWTEMRSMGQKSLQCLPFIFHWLQEHGVKDVYHHVTEVMDAKRRYFARTGPLALYWMLWRLGDKRTKAVCLIPHFTRKRPHEVFEFQRGERWTNDWSDAVSA